MENKEDFGTMVGGIIRKFGTGVTTETAEPNTASDDDLRNMIDSIVNDGVRYNRGQNWIDLKSALKVVDGRYRNALYTLTAVSENLGYDPEKTKMSLIGWSGAIKGQIDLAMYMKPELLTNAPNVARVAKGLDLLETAEKVEFGEVEA